MPFNLGIFVFVAILSLIGCFLQGVVLFLVGALTGGPWYMFELAKVYLWMGLFPFSALVVSPRMWYRFQKGVYASINAEHVRT